MRGPHSIVTARDNRCGQVGGARAPLYRARRALLVIHSAELVLHHALLLEQLAPLNVVHSSWEEGAV